MSREMKSISEMDLENLGRDTTSARNEVDIDGSQLNSKDAKKDEKHGVINNLFGSLTVVGYKSFSVFVRQLSSCTVWALYEQNVTEVRNDQQIKLLDSCLKVYNTGKILGSGNVAVLLRLLDNINIMNTHVVMEGGSDNSSFLSSYSYTDEETKESISYKTMLRSKYYTQFDMNCNGFILNLYRVNKRFAYPKDKDLQEVVNPKIKAAIVASLGVKTFALLRKQKGHELDWYDRKEYHLIDSDDKFKKVIAEYLEFVENAAQSNKTVLTGLDTETTGLNMFNLSPTNPYVDHIVAIPFAWRDDISYLICTDMAYFNNVSSDLIYPILNKIFMRNPDFGDHRIQVEWEGREYSFNRNNITLAGYNAMFDRMAFACHGADIYFDEDGMILMYDQAPALVKGNNGLKDWTHVMTGDITLELEELYGSRHKDKFRYLQDPELAKVYGCADSDYTRVVVRNGRRTVTKETFKQYKNYDIPIMNILATAAWRGMPIDSEAVRAEGREVAEDLECIMEFVYKFTYSVYQKGLSDRIGELAQILGFNKKTTDEDMNAVLSQSDSEHMFRFEFTPNNLKNLIFGTLNYPVLALCDNKTPKMDKFILDKLMQEKLPEPSKFMKNDLVSPSNPERVLISAAEFNSYRYPMAYVLTRYATINKEYTSYYKPIIEHDLEGKVFYNFNMAFAATRRILSPGQTMKGSLKKLVSAPKGWMTMCFDASQIEFRLMASLAYQLKMRKLQKSFPGTWEEELKKTAIYETFMEMQKEEADYHIQTAAQMTKTKKHLVKPKVRKRYKKVGFGIPYGLSVYSLCESIHGKVTDEFLRDTQELMDEYCHKQEEIIDLLESTRDSAFFPVEINRDLHDWLQLGTTPVGAVYNLVGSRYLYALTNLTRKHTERIRRQVGNCIIQGGAAELFRRMILNFYKACVSAGIEDKVNWFMIVHDELDTIVTNDIDAMLLIKLIYENCTLRYPNQIPYYVGIGFGYNWGEAKDDAAELPVIMVQRMIEAYDAGKFYIPSDGNQPVYLTKLKYQYYCDRVRDCLKELYPSLSTGHIWTEDEAEYVNEHFENYIVRAYLPSFISEEISSKAKAEVRSVTLQEQLQCWQEVRESLGFDSIFTEMDFGVKPVTEINIEDFDISLDDDADIQIEDNDLDIEPDIDLDGMDDLDISVESSDYSTLLDSLRSEFSDDDPDEPLTTNQWFDEDSMFDFNATDEMIASDEDNAAIVSKNITKGRDVEYTVNAKPTSAFDVLVTSKYTRKKTVKSSDDVYTVVLDGSEGVSMSTLKERVKSKMSNGSGKLMIVGESVDIMDNINLSEELLDELDKYVCGETTWD